MGSDSSQRPWRVVLGYDRTERARAAAVWAAGRLPLGGKLVIEQHSTVHRALGTVTDTLLDLSPVPVIVVPLTATREPQCAGSH